ncbi:MocR-like pyridoxine biosynthesis transcription factor PdxR [Ornithinicoccus halotolerans]|uniref:MocR-like pyridoxine biosynthesis transcription factor PdxR n=1 Tax=Ornithinicoccus halotolerans TaxID=1748220 RepID=UPI0012950AF5|nr:PLP-dependent aminotransferase family protein [Ornithinicoccus halotolerans]
MPRSARPIEVPLTLPPGSAPLPRRVADAVLATVADGRLAPGDPLPATRALAGQLGISRTSVIAAYEELLAAGYVVTRGGSGTYVAPGAREALVARAASHVTPAEAVPPPRPSRTLARDAPVDREGPSGGPEPLDLRPGRPDTGLVDRAEWRRAWRAAAAAPIADDAYTSDGPLAAALSGHLRRTRGVTVEPERLVLLPAVALGLRVLGMALGITGAQVAVEDPGYRRAVATFAGLGARVRPVPVDEDGLDPALLEPGDRGVYVTPAHQYPTGGRLPVERRAALVQWARRTGNLVVEDDYDGEFRYGVPPLPALHALAGAQDHVAYLGTVSKVLTPALRVAWLVPPPRLLEPVRAACDELRLGVGQADALALTELINSGGLTRHLARATRLYAARRAALVQALVGRLPVTGVEAGLHLTIPLPEDTDDQAVAARVERSGYLVEPLSSCARASTRRGLLVGYAPLPESRAPLVGAALTAAIEARSAAET